MRISFSIKVASFYLAKNFPYEHHMTVVPGWQPFGSSDNLLRTAEFKEIVALWTETHGPQLFLEQPHQRNDHRFLLETEATWCLDHGFHTFYFREEGLWRTFRDWLMIGFRREPSSSVVDRQLPV